MYFHLNQGHGLDDTNIKNLKLQQPPKVKQLTRPTNITLFRKVALQQYYVHQCFLFIFAQLSFFELWSILIRAVCYMWTRMLWLQQYYIWSRHVNKNINKKNMTEKQNILTYLLDAKRLRPCSVNGNNCREGIFWRSPKQIYAKRMEKLLLTCEGIMQQYTEITGLLTEGLTLLHQERKKL